MTTERAGVLRLGVDGQDVTLALNDEAAIDAFLRSAHLLDGWPRVDMYRHQLTARVETAEAGLRGLANPPRTADREAVRRGIADTEQVMLENRPALAAWQAACARFAPEVHQALAKVEVAAQALCLERLNAAKEVIHEEAKRYLTGYDDAIFAKETLRFPDTTTLAGNTDMTSLRTAVRHLEQVETEETLDKVADALLIAMASVLVPAAGTAVAFADIRRTAARATVRAALRDRLGAQHPVLHRMVPTVRGRAPLEPDEALQISIITALTTTWAAASTVARRAAVTMMHPDDVRFEEGPAAALGKRLAEGGIKGGGGFLRRLLGSPLGPWEYQKMVAEAVTDLVGPGVSATRQAVADAYGAADPSLRDGFAETAAIMGAMVTMHLVAPPLAVIADVVLAVKGIAEHVSSYMRDSDAYNCALDPADSLAAEPSVIRLALQCAGEVAGGLPPGKVTTLVSVVAPLTASLVD
ncbi:hypothetical protein [Amycolatopsis sp. NPDC051371]|uniref:hypothetical protein n=1 Tax=Amycolatopsis sp. NPDC051371 TaxID=3155800 RepID=UPI003436FE5B